MNRILVWDLPTRVFHWSLVISFFGAYLTAESERYRDIHVMLGYTALGLIAFRIIWGLVGSQYARFSSFLFSPSAVISYAKTMLTGKPKHFIGHNPLGSMAIWLLLSLIIALGITGIMLLYNIGGDALEEAHEILTYTMLGVVSIHVCGVITSSILHKENLARAMLTGHKYSDNQSGIRKSHRGLGILLLLAVVTFWVIYPNVANTPAETQQTESDD